MANFIVFQFYYAAAIHPHGYTPHEYIRPRADDNNWNVDWGGGSGSVDGSGYDVDERDVSFSGCPLPDGSWYVW